MEIKVRGLDVGAVYVIDDLAKKSKVSRNEYLKSQLENLAWLDKIRGERNRFEEAMRDSIIHFRYVEDQLGRQNKIVKRLNYLLMQAMDVTKEELAEFEREMIGSEVWADD